MHIIWKGHEIKSHRDMISLMRKIHDEKEVKHFLVLLQASLGVKSIHSFIFQLAAQTNDKLMKELIQRFLDKDCNDEFYVIQGPTQDKNPKQEAILKVRIIMVDDRVFLSVIEPTNYPWCRLNPRKNHYLIIDGPARILTHNEWVNILYTNSHKK